MEDGQIVDNDAVGQVFVMTLQRADGAAVARIMRTRPGLAEPDFLLTDGRWWRASGDVSGTAYAIPDETSHPARSHRETYAAMREGVKER
jgi:hypothetical protein